MKFRSTAAVILVFSVILSFCACRKLDTENFQPGSYVIDDSGEKHEVETTVNEKGDTEYFYVDNSGEQVVVEKKDIITTTAAYNEISLTPEQESFIESFNDPKAMEEHLDYSPEAELVIADDIIDTEEMEEVENTSQPLHPGRAEYISDLTAGDSYTLDVTLRTKSEGNNSTMNMVTCKSGDKLYFSTKIPTDNGGSMPLNILKANGKCTVYLPSYMISIDVPAESLQEMQNEINFAQDQEETGLEYQDSYTITGEDGSTYDVDLYKSEDVTVKYYFLGDDLKRVESSDGNGNDMIIEYNVVTTSVDESKFITPVGYIDMTNVIDSDEFTEDMLPSF